MGEVIPFRPRAKVGGEGVLIMNPAAPYLIGTALILLVCIALWDGLVAK